MQPVSINFFELHAFDSSDSRARGKRRHRPGKRDSPRSAWSSRLLLPGQPSPLPPSSVSPPPKIPQIIGRYAYMAGMHPGAQGSKAVSSDCTRLPDKWRYRGPRVIRFSVATCRKNSLRERAGLPSNTEQAGTSEITPACAPIWLRSPMRRWPAMPTWPPT